MSRPKKVMKAETPVPAEVVELRRPNYKDLARSILDHVAKEYLQLGPLQFRLVVAGMKHAKAEGRYWASITRKDS